MKKFIKIVILFLIVYCMINAATPYFAFMIKRSQDNQITYLSQYLKKGGGLEQQQRYPEGYIFSHAVLALSVIEKMKKDGKANDSSYISTIIFCIDALLHPQAVNGFNIELTPQYGIFYKGWTNYVLKNLLTSPLSKYIPAVTLDRYTQNYLAFSTEIREALKSSSLPLESYLEMAWPADNIVAIMSLQDDSIVHQELNQLLECSKNPHKLIHHMQDDPMEIRGCSQALINYMIQSSRWDQKSMHQDSFAKVMKINMRIVSLIKEHEDGKSIMDIDSGPVLFGIGSVATIVNIKNERARGQKSADAT